MRAQPACRPRAPGGTAWCSRRPMRTTAAATPLTMPLPRDGPLSPPEALRRRIAEAPWRGGLEPCGDVDYEIAPAQVEGTLPAELRGTLYRAGPGRIRVGKHLYGHWFDGDGAMTGFAIDGARGSVRVTSRLVATPRLAAQQAAGEEGGFPTRGAWTQATAFWRNLFALPTNPSNTSALRWAGKLMALCEGGAPMELDPVTLQTRGPVTFSGQERQLSVLGFGAHFKIDPVTRVLYNIGVQLPSALRIFALSPDGREVAASSISFPAGELAFVHDWAMSANHLVLFIPPWYCGPMEALASVVGLRALGHAFTWRAERPTRCVVLRKRDLAVVHDSEVPAFSTYHFANAWEEGSVLKVHVNRLLGDRAALEANFSNMYSAEWQREQYNELVEFALDLSSPASRVTGGQPVARGAMPMEFPIVSHRYAGRKNRFVYATGFSGSGSGYFDALQKYDLETGAVQTRRCASGEFPSEVTFVPKPGSSVDSAPEDAGFLLYVVYVAARHASDLYVLDAADFEGPPLCVCRLPTHAPYSFHGWFERAAA